MFIKDLLDLILTKYVNIPFLFITSYFAGLIIGSVLTTLSIIVVYENITGRNYKKKCYHLFYCSIFFYFLETLFIILLFEVMTYYLPINCIHKVAEHCFNASNFFIITFLVFIFFEFSKAAFFFVHSIFYVVVFEAVMSKQNRFLLVDNVVGQKIILIVYVIVLINAILHFLTINKIMKILS